MAGGAPHLVCPLIGARQPLHGAEANHLQREKEAGRAALDLQSPTS